MATKRPREIISLDDFLEPKNILVYGDAGVGKTPFGASAPKCLIIASEAGTISAKRLGVGKDADVWPCNEDWSQFVKAYRWLKDNSDPTRDGVGWVEQPHGYEWVVIDNATQMQEIMMRSIIDAARVGNPNRDEDIPAIQDYQKWYNMFDRFVKQFNALPVSCLWLAHTMRKETSEGEELILPAIQGQDYAQASKFCGRMQAIGFLEQRLINQGGRQVYQRRIRWRKNQNVFAKDRYIFDKDERDTFTIAAVGNKEVTDMAEISRRIDAAIEAKPKARTTGASKTAAKKATPAKATARKTSRRRVTSR